MMSNISLLTPLYPLQEVVTTSCKASSGMGIGKIMEEVRTIFSSRLGIKEGYQSYYLYIMNDTLMGLTIKLSCLVCITLLLLNCSVLLCITLLLLKINCFVLLCFTSLLLNCFVLLLTVCLFVFEPSNSSLN